jgi:adenylate cyclase
VLLADLRGFTAYSASLDPVGTVRLLNDYFDCLVGPIEEYHGHVLKFIGDAVLAFFPVLPEGPQPRPLDTVRCIRTRLTKLNSARRDDGKPPLRHGLCIHYGQVLYGNVGSTERLDFTIIGQAVNVAARAVDATRSLDADYLFTGDFVRQFGDKYLVPIDTFAFRGVPESIVLFTFEADSSESEHSIASGSQS